ncbi:MAG: hypothetical protein ACI4U2_07440 [Christensenellaceae bacterium]
MKDFRNDNSTNEETLASQILREKKGKGEEDILSEIFARAAEGKKNGTLTDREIDDFVKRISPMLSPAQKAKLSALVRRLKEL